MRLSGWDGAYGAVSNLLAVVDNTEWNQRALDSMLCIVAADNEIQKIASDIAEYPKKLLYLADASIHSKYHDAKWQFAIELGQLLVHHQEVERILYAFAQDEDEYTRRRALGALADAGSTLVNDLIEPAWETMHEYQRMTVLSALYKISSPQLERYLALADLDGRQYLVAWAARIRTGNLN